MSAMPSVGSMRRSSSATSKRVPSTAVDGRLGVGGGGDVEAHGDQAHLEHLDDGQRRRRPPGPCASSPASLQLEVDLLEASRGRSSAGRPRPPYSWRARTSSPSRRGELLAQPRQLLAQPRQLGAQRVSSRAAGSSQRVPAGRARGAASASGWLRQELAVGGDRLLPARPRGPAGRRASSSGGAGTTSGHVAQPRRQPPASSAASARAQRDARLSACVPSRGSSTVNRLPLPSCDSAVTRPPCACTRPRTMASPRPVPPLPRWACR